MSTNQEFETKPAPQTDHSLNLLTSAPAGVGAKLSSVAHAGMY